MPPNRNAPRLPPQGLHRVTDEEINTWAKAQGALSSKHGLKPFVPVSGFDFRTPTRFPALVIPMPRNIAFSMRRVLCSEMLAAKVDSKNFRFLDPSLWSVTVALIHPSVCSLQDDADLAAVKRAMAKIMAKITKETHKTPRSTFVVNGIVVSENGVRVVFTADTWNRVLATRAMVHELAPLVGAYGDDLGEPAPQGRAIQVPVAMPNVSIPPTEAAKLVEGLSSLLPGKCGPFSFSPDEMDLVMYEFGPDLGLRTRTAPLAHAPFKAQSIEPLAR